LTTEEIIKIAFDLGNAINESDEVNNLRLQQVEVMKKKEAYDLIMSYQDAKDKLEHKLMDGLMITEQEENHLKELEQQLNDHPDIQSLLKAQEKVDNLMQAVYFAINQAISGSCGGGCDSCGSSCGGC